MFAKSSSKVQSCLHYMNVLTPPQFKFINTATVIKIEKTINDITAVRTSNLSSKQSI
jgi:hypothetical protein